MPVCERVRARERERERRLLEGQGGERGMGATYGVELIRIADPLEHIVVLEVIEEFEVIVAWYAEDLV